MSRSNKNLDLIIDYVHGKLTPEQRSLVEKLIDDDRTVQDLVRLLKDMKDEDRLSDWGKMKNPSHSLFDRLLRDVKSRKRDATDKKGITVYDSKYLPLPEGVRSEAVESRRIKYVIGPYQLEISTYPVSPNSYEVIGQVSDYDSAKLLNVKLQKGKSIMKADANQFHLFRFPRVPSGKYRLAISEGRTLIGKIDLEL